VTVTSPAWIGEATLAAKITIARRPHERPRATDTTHLLRQAYLCAA
jgi:hypothetical protein